MTESSSRFAPGRRTILVLVVLLAVVLTAIWAVRQRGVSEVLDHPVIGVLKGAGWDVGHDRRFHAGFLGRTLMGGMIQHPLQREIHFAPKEERVGVLQVEVERRLFGEAGLNEPFSAYGLEWSRRVSGASAITFHAEPLENANTRLEFLGAGGLRSRAGSHLRALRGNPTLRYQSETNPQFLRPIWSLQVLPALAKDSVAERFARMQPHQTRRSEVDQSMIEAAPTTVFSRARSQSATLAFRHLPQRGEDR